MPNTIKAVVEVTIVMKVSARKKECVTDESAVRIEVFKQLEKIWHLTEEHEIKILEMDL